MNTPRAQASTGIAAAPGPFARQLAHQYGLDDRATPGIHARLLDMACMRYALPHLFVLEPLPADDAFVLSVALARAGSRRIVHDGTQTELGPMEAGAVQIDDLATRPRGYVCSPFHSLLFRISRTALDDFAQDIGLRPVGALQCKPGATDPVLAHLAMALLPSLERPHEASTLFIDQVSLAVHAHVGHAYGHLAQGDRMLSRLAPWQERRARELLEGDLTRDLSLAEVAAQCGLSRSHFGKAFKVTTGQTPHAWRMRHRVLAAQRLLRQDTMPLPEIAAACGFADQSHMTRVFGAQVGTPPALWRRMLRG